MWVNYGLDTVLTLYIYGHFLKRISGVVRNIFSIPEVRRWEKKVYTRTIGDPLICLDAGKSVAKHQDI